MKAIRIADIDWTIAPPDADGFVLETSHNYFTWLKNRDSLMWVESTEQWIPSKLKTHVSTYWSINTAKHRLGLI